MDVINICNISLCIILMLPAVAKFEAISLCDGTTNRIGYDCHCELFSSEIWYLPLYTIDCTFKNISNLNATVSIDDSEKLDLSSNSISIITEDNFLRGPYLRILNLNDNALSEISINAFTNMPSLQRLDLSNNRLSFIKPGVFHGIYKLEELNLASNSFTSFEQYTFTALPILKYLNLNKNDIGNFVTNASNIFSPNGLSINPKLVGLYLENVGITDVPSTFLDAAYNLREISFAKNSITKIPTMPFTLEILDLSSTLITEILAKYLVNVPGLRILKLNNLPYLKNIADYAFHPLKALSRLELQNCRNLSTFSVRAFGQNAIHDEDYDFPLEEITFRGSGLTGLSPRLEPLFDKLTELDLQGNPWNCDCKIGWIRKLNIKKEHQEHIRCFEPRYLYNHQVFALTDNQLFCETFKTRLSFFVNTLLVIMCLFLTGLSIWLVFLWPKYKERRYILQKSLSPNSPYSRITIEPNRAEEIG